MSFIAELKRRNVFQVAVAYLLLAWLVMQLGDVLAPALHLPDWVPSLLAFFLILGFPLALFFSWAYELTDEGLRREKSVGEGQIRAAGTGRTLNIVITGLLVIAAGYYFWQSRLQGASETSAGADRSGTIAAGHSAAEQAPTPQESNAAPSGTIAVLPFVNVSENRENDYFSDGITEEIINALVKIPGLTVPARTTIFAFKGERGDIRDIGRSLGVAHVVEGSVRSVADQARITASLIDVTTGLPVWSETYDRRLENIFAVQDELATAIATELQVELGGVDAVPNRTRDMAAYDSYLKGRAALRKRESGAIALLQDATRTDPGFAPAWASLAIAQQTNPLAGEAAIEAARRALEIDSDNVDALTAMASVFRQTRRWREADEYFNRALSIDPGSAELLEDYTEFLNLVGRSRDALEYASRGMDIDPRLQPLVAAYVEALFSRGRAAEARRAAIESMQAHGSTMGFWYVVLPLWLGTSADGAPSLPPAELNEEAYRFLQQMLEPPSEEMTSKLISELESPDRKRDASSRTARLLLLHFGEVDAVIDFDIAHADAFPYSMREWIWTPFFDAYRAHPRFPEFLESVRLTEYWDETSWPEQCKRQADGTVACA